MKREKNRDKFFTTMWNGVKWLWKVLKPKERLLSPKDEIDNEVLAAWSDLDDARDDAETERNGIP